VAERLPSLIGTIGFLTIAWLLSKDRRRIPWRTVAWGVGLQLALGLTVLKTEFGRGIFDIAQAAANRLIAFAQEGASMVFGPLANRQLLTTHWGADNAYIFAVNVASIIIFISALSALLYHWGVLPRLIRAAAWVMRRSMKTSGSESLAAAANIFMGMTEAPLLVRPLLDRMTLSELMALMTGGMATIAGSVFATYVGFGISAGHLLTASVMSAPAALMMAKIMWPETEALATDEASPSLDVDYVNSLDALCRGANDGMRLAINVMAMLVAFVAAVAMANFLLTWPQQALFGLLDWNAKPVDFQTLIGWINAPFAWMMGVPSQDCVAVGRVLGERIVLNEFIGYLDLAQLKAHGNLAARSETLATYALCGFANFASIAIQIGGIGALAPSRRGDLARLGLRSMLAGLLACYFTASLVGLLS